MILIMIMIMILMIMIAVNIIITMIILIGAVALIAQWLERELRWRSPFTDVHSERSTGEAGRQEGVGKSKGTGRDS